MFQRAINFVVDSAVVLFVVAIAALGLLCWWVRQTYGKIG